MLDPPASKTEPLVTESAAVTPRIPPFPAMDQEMVESMQGTDATHSMSERRIMAPSMSQKNGTSFRHSDPAACAGAWSAANIAHAATAPL